MSKNELNAYTPFHMRIRHRLAQASLFVEVVRQGGFSRAAKVVFATQPTVSKAVKQLEDELGVLCSIASAVAASSPPRATSSIAMRSALLTGGEESDRRARRIARSEARSAAPRVSAGREQRRVRSMFASFRRRHPGVEVELAVHDPNAWKRSCVPASSTSPRWCTDTQGSGLPGRAHRPARGARAARSRPRGRKAVRMENWRDFLSSCSRKASRSMN